MTESGVNQGLPVGSDSHVFLLHVFEHMYDQEQALVHFNLQAQGNVLLKDTRRSCCRSSYSGLEKA